MRRTWIIILLTLLALGACRTIQPGFERLVFRLDCVRLHRRYTPISPASPSLPVEKPLALGPTVRFSDTLLGGVLAQRPYRGGYGRGRGSNDRRPVPQWENDREFAKDVFTFVRIRFSSYGGYSGYDGFGGGYGGRRGRGRGSWSTDWPDSDLNFAYRLHQLTAMEVNPEGVILDLTDPELFNYPFIYMLQVERLVFSDEEVQALRSYLLNGGFLMVDDFWGEDDWWHFYQQIKRVFPNREPEEIPLDHEIFRAVFVLKERPQIPGIGVWLRYGVTYEREDAKQVHYRALYDDQGRMMAIICHNTDLGDGWEEEASNPDYFREFSEKYAYPLGINIVFYAMTH